MKKPDLIVSIEKHGNKYRAFDVSSSRHEYTDQIKPGALAKAYKMNYKLGRFERPNPVSTLEMFQWRKLNIPNIPVSETTSETTNQEAITVPEEQMETMQFIHSSYDLKPKGLVMSELKWKYLIRSAIRGKNIMMTGPAGCGKTMSAKALVNALDRPDFYFNLGATQDPRATLIGNTHFNADEGTYFSESLFVQAIRTPNAVILLDELTRAHPDAWNILMTVLDQNQRYLRLDEKSDSETVRVAEGVTFIATANIGNEYTATRVLDKALMDRFTIIEMDELNDTEEHGLLEYMFPNVDKKMLNNVATIANLTRIEARNENPRISNGISTRTSIELTGLLYDGFELQDAADITIYPQYDATGGVDSERTFVKQIVQKFINDGTSEELFDQVDQDAIVS